MHFQLQVDQRLLPNRTSLAERAMHIQVLEEWVGIEKANQNSFWLLNPAVSLPTKKTQEPSFPDWQVLN